MKKILLALAVLLCGGTMPTKADGGMWLLKLMEQQHLADSLRAAGLEIDPSELYNENGPSLKDVIGLFGGGCTGEVVSSDGLVFTNNHCGFDFVHKMSTMEHNYLQDGYYAQSRAEELPVPELDFVFVRAIEDATEFVVSNTEDADEYTRQNGDLLEVLARKLLESSMYKDMKGISCRIVPYFSGNQFYAFFEQTYTDLRLVTNVPQSLGQFGGNQDNWMWPRHNPDFAVFRIYADADGQPADYDPANTPLKCAKYLPISIREIQNGDYTMVMGFPGSTNRYLTASEIESRTRNLNEPINELGTQMLDHMKQLMDNDKELNLSMASDYFMLGNTVKNFGGCNEAVRKTRLVERTRQNEEGFRQWAKANGKPEYETIIDRIDSVMTLYGDTIHDMYLANFLLSRAEPGFIGKMKSVNAYMAAVSEKKKDDAAIELAREAVWSDFKGISDTKLRESDRVLTKKLFRTWVTTKRLPLTMGELGTTAQTDALIDAIYDRSIFTDSLRLAAFLAKPKQKVLDEDPLYQASNEALPYVLQLYFPMMKQEMALAELDKIYTAAQLERNDFSTAPDANMTLRMTYGHVCDLKPRDGVTYDYRTVIDGMFEKENPADPDYVIRDDVRAVYEAGDFGRWARSDGKLPACFITNNDITGGNSGSPVMNARGELIGLAFDGNIESLSSDLEFRNDLQRCISVDVRYVLWCIDKLGHQKYVIDELEIRK